MSGRIGSKRGVYRHGRLSTYSKQGCRCTLCVETFRARRRQTYHKHHNAAGHRWHIKSHYGLSYVEYETMLDRQKGVCLICGGLNKKGERLFVDHDHATGAIRGLLCRKCNMHLGWYEKFPGAVNDYLNGFHSIGIQQAKPVPVFTRMSSKEDR